MIEPFVGTLAIQTHRAAREFQRCHNLDKGRTLIRVYYRLLGSIGGTAVAYELSGPELDAVNQAAAMTRTTQHWESDSLTYRINPT